MELCREADVAMGDTPGDDRLADATIWLPVVVGALLVAIIAIFIFEAPNQIITPNDTGYLNTELQMPNSSPVQTGMG
jgi:multidrug efflux pump subunit AcrB